MHALARTGERGAEAGASTRAKAANSLYPADPSTFFFLLLFFSLFSLYGDPAEATVRVNPCLPRDSRAGLLLPLDSIMYRFSRYEFLGQPKPTVANSAHVLLFCFVPSGRDPAQGTGCFGLSICISLPEESSCSGLIYRGNCF